MLRAIINLTMAGGLLMSAYGMHALLFGDIMPKHAAMYLLGGAFVAAFMFFWSSVLVIISKGAGD